jgi:hypothetical protein
LVPADVRRALEALRVAGTALGESPLGRPTLGVKCGCNAAFVVSVRPAVDSATPERTRPPGLRALLAERDDLVRVASAGHESVMERMLLRPVLRGEALTRAAASSVRTSEHEEAIVFPYDVHGTLVRTLPPYAARWLGRWRRELESRRDLRGSQPWWSLFRLDGAAPGAPRLVWADIARRFSARVLEADDPTVPLNSCYVLRTATLADAASLTRLLESPLAAAWFAALAEPARGGFRRYMGWTVASFPIPRQWDRARSTFAAASAREDRAPGMSALSTWARAYDLSPRVLAPLFEWVAR